MEWKNPPDEKKLNPEHYKQGDIEVIDFIKTLYS